MAFALVCATRESVRGAVTQKDSLDNEGRTEAGDVQVMSAGAGIRHAEYNLADARCGLRAILTAGPIPVVTASIRGWSGDGGESCRANGRRAERKVASFI
jgi:Pirin